MTEVVLGLGTNLGDRIGHLRRAVRALRAAVPELLVERISPIYESDALVPADAPADWRLPYLNLALRARFEGPLDHLLGFAKATERALGRTPGPRWAPREADIDVLAFGTERIALPRITVPHQGLADRPFALLPMADVWPDWVFPPETAFAGRTAEAAARRWRGDSSTVPFRTRRSGLSLTELVGIVNLTPDSFSDGGLLPDPETAVAHASRLAVAGATVLDLGAESTRPGGIAISPELEWTRLEPVLRRLRESAAPGILISVDTRHAATAERAIDAGADWINDVTGFADPAMRRAVRGASVQVVAMHSLAVPVVRGALLPPEADPIEVVTDWARRRIAELDEAGIDRRRVVIDPGVGFGKSVEQNVALVAGAGQLLTLGCRVLVGHSRKSFLGRWFEPSEPAAAVAAERDLETAVLSAALAAQQIDYVRVHDVAGSARALRAWSFAGPIRS